MARSLQSTRANRFPRGTRSPCVTIAAGDSRAQVRLADRAATQDIARGRTGAHRNLATRLEGLNEYAYRPVPRHDRAASGPQRRRPTPSWAIAAATAASARATKSGFSARSAAWRAPRSASRASAPRVSPGVSTACTPSRIPSAARSSATILHERAACSPRSPLHPNAGGVLDHWPRLRIESARSAARRGERYRHESRPRVHRAERGRRNRARHQGARRAGRDRRARHSASPARSPRSPSA